MTQPNLDALAKQGPFFLTYNRERDTWRIELSGGREVGLAEVCYALNDWLRLRAEVEQLRRDNESMDSRIRGYHD